MIAMQNDRPMDESTESNQNIRSTSSNTTTMTTTKKTMMVKAMDHDVDDNDSKRNSSHNDNDTNVDNTNIDNNTTWNGSDEANNHQNDGSDSKPPKVPVIIKKKKKKKVVTNSTKSDANTIEKEKKPTRPLSAYNLFFREERVNWLKEEKPAIGDDDDTSGNDPKSSSQHRPIFESMAKEVGKRWKELDESKRRKYIDMAKIETERYQCQLRQFKEQKKKDGRQQKKQKNNHNNGDEVTEQPLSGSNNDTGVAAFSGAGGGPFSDPSSSSSVFDHQKSKEHPKRTDDPPHQQQLPPKKRIMMDGTKKRESNNNNNNNAEAIEWSNRHDGDADDGAGRPGGNHNAKKKQKKTMNNTTVPSEEWGRSSNGGVDPNQNQNNHNGPSSASFRQAIIDGIERDRQQQQHLSDTNEMMTSRGIKPWHPLLETTVDGYPSMTATSAGNHEQMLRERLLLMQQQQKLAAGLVDASNATATTKNDNSPPTLPTTTLRREQETSSIIESLLLRQQQQQQQQQLLHDHPNGSGLPSSSSKIDLSMLSDEQLQLLAEQRGIRSKTTNNPLLDHPSAMLLANPKSLRDLYGSIGNHGMMGMNVDNAATAAAVAMLQQQPTSTTTTNPMQELLLRRHLLEQQQQQQQKEQQLLYLQRLEQQQILQQQQQLQQKLKTALPLPTTTLPSFANNNNNNMSLMDEIRLRQRFGLPIPKHLLQELNGLPGNSDGMVNDGVGIGGMFPKQRLTTADALLGGNLLHVGKGGPTNKNNDKVSSPLLPQSAAAAIDNDNTILRNHINSSNHMNDYKNMDRDQLLRLLAMKQQQNMNQSNNLYR